MKGGLPKIADFGFATTPRSRPTMPNVNVGSPLYMSPQALRQNKYSEKSDIWALGATTYELLFGILSVFISGQVPWQACSEKELG
jgi:SNF-related kinase